MKRVNPQDQATAYSQRGPTENFKVTPRTRSLSEIAADIRNTWGDPNYAANPYLKAMAYLDKITDMYFADSASSVVRYFLNNATMWRGEDARRIKAELNALLKGKGSAR